MVGLDTDVIMSEERKFRRQTGIIGHAEGHSCVLVPPTWHG